MTDSSSRWMCAAIAMFVWLPSLSTATCAAEEDEARTVEELLRERVDVLESIVKIQRTAYQSGRAPFRDLLSAEEAVLKARLELAGSANERIAIYAELVKNARELERLTQTLQEQAIVSRVDFLQAKALRLKAEADLLRAMSELDDKKAKD